VENVSRQLKASLELGALSAVITIWLAQTVTIANWWQLAVLWCALAIAYAITVWRRLPVEGLLVVSFFIVISWLFMTRINTQLALLHWRGLLLGIVAYCIALMFNWHSFKYKYVSGSIVLLLLLLTWSFGDVAGGAKAWLRLGSLRFQPIEVARVFLLLFLSGYLFDNRELLQIRLGWPNLRYWGPVFTLMLGVFLFLAIQRDLGPALLFFLLFVSLAFYVAFNWYALLTYLFVACGGLLTAWFGFQHIRQRFTVWLHPWQDVNGAGYQIVQGLFALNNGGIFGIGLGFGLGNDIPAVHTDYIYALIGEELGFIGASVILVFYLLLLYFGLKTARQLNGRSHILAISIVFLWLYQVFIVIGGILKVVPLSGMTLPFLSYGNTSTITNMWLLGMLTQLGDKSIQEGDMSAALNVKRVFIWVVALLGILWGSLCYWQLVRTDLASHPSNPVLQLVFRQPRGSIFDRHGNILASTETGTGVLPRRYYGSPSLVHILGYFHHRYGMTGLEAKYNQQLANQQDIYLTVDMDIQAAIEQCMQDYVGAVVVMQPQTGAILALYSSPYIDANNLEKNWNYYLQSSKSPFFNRAVNGAYPPGSTIKPLWLAAAYQLGVATPETLWFDAGTVDIQGRTVNNFNRAAYGHLTTQQALSVSSNVVFAQLAVQLKTEGLKYLRSFGLGVKPGNLPDEQLSDYGWAQLGIGQGAILVSPLQMATAISAIANRGVMMEPYMVQRITGNWFTRKTSRPKMIGQIITAQTAAWVRDAMVEAVRNGTGQAAQINGITVAGKTGTAEVNQGTAHSWFVGFAPAEDPQVTVVVIVEHGGSGGGLAARIAGQILEAALKALTKG